MNKKEPKLDYLGSPPRKKMTKAETCFLIFATTIILICFFIKYVEIK